jgi:hypothetical protein
LRARAGKAQRSLWFCPTSKVASFKRTRNASSAGSANNSVLYPIAKDPCERLNLCIINPSFSDETVDAVANSGPEAALAKGVLVQTKQDLRGFRSAKDRIGREIYADAHGWVAADDRWWPYSFLNVCEVLGLSPAALRAELLSETQSGWYSHSRRIARRISISVSGSLANIFGTRSSVAGPRESNRPVITH